MDLKPGEKLGPYEIVSRIGKGGMGEVWCAHDARLNRNVAIKISARQFTDRFEREARVIAALNHSGICTLFDIGPDYIVMELVEGPTLAERCARGPIPLEEALDIARQIADALEAAHEKGIVHRDLKPANIKIRPDGSVKVLDFGLAKATEPMEFTPDSPTESMTVQGTVMGTLGYMPPEQILGAKVDKRADIWAFGVILHEMVTGKRLFHGRTTSETVAAVIGEEPVWEPVPATMRQLLRRCLEKDPKRRLRDIGDAMPLVETGLVVPGDRSHSRFARAGWIAAGISLLVSAVLAFIYLRGNATEQPLLRLNMAPPETTHFPGSNGMMLAVSPDGSQVVLSAVSADGKNQLWLRPLNSSKAQLLAGTDNAMFPFWSPDSKSLGFFAGGKLRKVEISGGPARALADAPNARGGTWNRDGVIVFAPTPYELQQVPAAGGSPRPFERVGSKSTARRYPWFLPDGRHFLYLYGSAGNDFAIRIGSLNPSEHDRTLPGTADSLVVYAQDHLLFLRGDTLLAAPFDSKRLALGGEAVPVGEDVQMRGLVSGAAKLSVSANGVLVYRTDSTLRLTWLDRAGRPLGIVGESATRGEGNEVNGVRFSPDHRNVAVQASDSTGGNPDIWLYDVSRGLRTRFTSDPAEDGVPVWSPDGRTIVFHSSRTGHFELYRKPADGSQKEELLYADSQQKFPSSFSPDGKLLAYQSLDPNNGFNIWILPDPLGPLGASKPYPFLPTEFNEQDPQFAPDGHWIAYVSNESGRNEVYIAPFPGPGGGKRQISAAGGTQPRWQHDGKELFYVAPDSHLMVARLAEKGGAIGVENVERLFGPLTTAGYDVSADGQRVLALLPPEGETGGPLTVVENWTAGLRH